jgi:ribokinase
VSTVVVAGSLNLDYLVDVAHIPASGETILGDRLVTAEGGKGANQAHSAARVAAPGTRVAMVGCVGDDDAGRRQIAALAAHGVDTSLVATVDRPSGQAFIAVDPQGSNTIIVASGANFAWPDATVEAVPFDGAGVLVVQLEIPLAAVARLAERAHEAGWRVVLNSAPPQRLPHGLLLPGDVLVVNELEAAVTLGLATPQPAALAAVAERWPCDLVVTLGGDGLIVQPADGPHAFVPAFPVAAIDTVGAGDAFVGTLAVALAEGRPLEQAARLGAAAGALTATVPGARHQTLTADTLAVMAGLAT